MTIDYTDPMKHRLRRVEGQVRGVINMMDKQKNCDDVVNQLSAIRAAIDRVIMYVIGQNMQHCIREEYCNGGESTDNAVDEAIYLLMKSR